MWLTAFLDVPAEVAGAESALWEAVTATSRSTARGDDGKFWSLQPSPGHAEFARLASRPGDSFRVLVQRVDDGDAARVHLDLATDDRTNEVERMLALGAHEVRRSAEWTTLHDPAGLPFCVTDRDPAAPWGA